MELSKKLDIWYKSPPMPVDLSLVGGSINSLNESLNRNAVSHPPVNPAGDPAIEPDLTELHNQFRPQFDWQR